MTDEGLHLLGMSSLFFVSINSTGVSPPRHLSGLPDEVFHRLPLVQLRIVVRRWSLLLSLVPLLLLRGWVGVEGSAAVTCIVSGIVDVRQRFEVSLRAVDVSNGPYPARWGQKTSQ